MGSFNPPPSWSDPVVLSAIERSDESLLPGGPGAQGCAPRIKGRSPGRPAADLAPGLEPALQATAGAAETVLAPAAACWFSQLPSYWGGIRNGRKMACAAGGSDA